MIFRKGVQRLVPFLLAAFVFFTCLPDAGAAKNTPDEVSASADTGETGPKVIEVSDFASFANAIRLATEEDDLGAATAVWSEAEKISLSAAEGDLAKGRRFLTKRLIVKSDEGFDTCGAANIIQGYDSLFILTYDTEEQTKAAYETLRAVPYLAVEPDVLIEVQTEENKPEIFKAAESNALKLLDAGQAAVVAAVLDTGFDFAKTSRERIFDGADFSGSGTVQDENGHGTAMADIIRRGTDDEVSILPVRITDADGRSTALKLYLGMEYALAAGADVVNVSMSAYRPSDQSLIAEEIKKLKTQGIYVVAAAGNYGGDTADYVPANAEEAIVVSAINSDDEADGYSNHGSTVDYCAYGSVTAAAGGTETSVSGTSISAAIVSAVIAGKKAENGGISYEAMLAELDAQAKDLGDAGWDPVYGHGALYAEGILPEGEGEWEGTCCELLSCDWKSLTDEELNVLIDAADEIDQKRFLDGLSEAEREELLAREDILYNHAHTAAAYDVEAGTGESGEKERFQGTLKDYLSSSFFEEYVIQAEKEYGKYNGNQPYWAASLTGGVKVKTDQGGDYGKTVTVHFKQQGGQPTDKYKVTVSATNAGAFDFSGMGVCGRFLTGDDNGHNLGNTPVPMAAFVNGITVKKSAHSKVSGQSRTLEKTATRLVVGGFYGPKKTTITDGDYKKYTDHISAAYGSNGCGTSSTANVGLMISIFEAKPDEDQTFTLNFLQHTLSDSYGDWIVTQNPTCTGTGFKARTKSSVCSGCKEVVKTETQTEAIAALGHVFDHYGYMADNGIANGKRWLECGRYCAEPGWQKDVQYLQQIYYRYMDADGNYPGYSEHLNQYCDAGSVVPGWNYAETADGEFLSASGGVGNYYANNANVVYINVPRKQYSVVYNANGADSGSTAGQENICCGKTFHLSVNGFKRMGYEFIGWAKSQRDADKRIVTYSDRETVKNLTLTNGKTISLFAVWKPIVYKVTLDNQGANVYGTDKIGNQVIDTAEVYEHYTVGYYQDSGLNKAFKNNKIVIPQKEVDDSTLRCGKRRQQFLGYFTRRNGGGYQMTEKDGSLIARMGGKNKGEYVFFRSDQTVYACWNDKYAIQYDLNLSEKDRDILSFDRNGNSFPDPVRCPETDWKNEGEAETVRYDDEETDLINNPDYKDIYRFLGWSLTPEIDSEDEIILNEEKTSYTFTADEDVTLYAQWDSSFRVAYIGNVQSEGVDYLDEVSAMDDGYTFTPNGAEEVALLKNADADYFVKTVEKPTMDISTGRMKDDDGNPYMETVPYSFRGWSMFKDIKDQDRYEQWKKEDGAQENAEIIGRAKEHNNLTYGAPATDYGTFNAVHKSENLLAGGKGTEVTVEELAKGSGAGEADVPYVNMYAIWDQYPQIFAGDLYYSLQDARSGRLTEEFLLELASAVDEELKSGTNPEGRMKNGKDAASGTSFSIPDYRSADFTGAADDMSMTLTYRAEDFAGNVTEKKVWIYLVETAEKPADAGYTRFISEEYLDTLEENSLWRKDPAFASKLASALSNKKTGQKYTDPTPMQRIFGARPAEKPGSGKWEHLLEVWEFSHEQILEIQRWMEQNGKTDPRGFLEKFKSCRTRP